MKLVAPCSVKVKQKSILFFPFLDRQDVPGLRIQGHLSPFFLIICYEEKAAWD